MNWREPVIDYCERLDGGFWAEPANALTNGAFLVAAVAAFVSWRRRGAADGPVLALILVTAGVGVGSFVFHTLATRGAMLLDVIPIAVFIYGYFLLALRRFFGLGAWAAAAVTIGFAAGAYLIDAVASGLNGSLAYLPALGAMVCFSALLWLQSRRDAPAAPLRSRLACGLAGAALLFFISLCFRTVDREVCALLPLGTHFLWHVLNACVLYLLLRTAMLARAEVVSRR